MKYLDDVFRYAMARLGHREEAEDVAIEVVQALPTPCHRRDLRVYMLGMARRKVADRMRRTRPVVTIREHEAAERFDVRADEAAMVACTMQRLSAEHREALALKYVAGLSSAEMGQVLGKRAEAVNSLLQRARDAFSREWSLLTSEEGDHERS